MAALALAFSAGAAGPADIDNDPANLRRELNRLRVIYTDEHPDVVRVKRALERAEQARRTTGAPAAKPKPRLAPDTIADDPAEPAPRR